MTTLLLVMVGGAIGFFTAALCNAAGRADREIDLLEVQEQRIADIIMPEVQKEPDLVQETIELEKETIV